MGGWERERERGEVVSDLVQDVQRGGGGRGGGPGKVDLLLPE